jgi:hypothetical protein
MRDNFIPEIEYFTQEKIAVLIEESFKSQKPIRAIT